MSSQFQKQIAAAIQQAVIQKVTTDVEDFVKKTVLKSLEGQQLTTRKSAREANNRDTILVEAGNDIRRKVGSLVSKRVKARAGERIRFVLDGVQPRNPKDAIDEKKLAADVKAAVEDGIKRGIIRRFR